MATSLNSSGASHAASLVSSGNVTKSGSWSAPSAESGDAFIKSNSISEYGKFFLGKDDSIDSKNKGHYKYPYSSDFKNVNRAGLIAIRQRAGQQHETEIFNKAGSLLEKIDGKKKMKAVSELSGKTLFISIVDDYE